MVQRGQHNRQLVLVLVCLFLVTVEISSNYSQKDKVIIVTECYLCSLGCPGMSSVDQVGFKLRDLPASVSRVLGSSKVDTTMPGIL